MANSIYEIRECPECSSSNLSYLEEREQVVCRECGLVYEPLTPAEEKKYGKPAQPAKKPGSAKKANPAKKPAKKAKPLKHTNKTAKKAKSKTKQKKR